MCSLSLSLFFSFSLIYDIILEMMFITQFRSWVFVSKWMHVYNEIDGNKKGIKKHSFKINFCDIMAYSTFDSHIFQIKKKHCFKLVRNTAVSHWNEMKCDVASRILSRKCIIFPFTHVVVFFVSYDLSKTLQSFVLSHMSYQNISNMFHRISIIILHIVIWSANEIYYRERGSKRLSKLAKDLSRSIFFKKCVTISRKNIAAVFTKRCFSLYGNRIWWNLVYDRI